MMRALAALAMILTCLLTGASAEEQSCTGKACLNIGHHDEVSMLQVNISKHISRQRAPNDAAWQKSALDEHNKLRAKHGAPPLSWCDSCARDAKKAADSASRKNVLEHSNHDGQGQNAAFAIPARGADKATDSWYSEISDYNFQAGSGPGTGHFTQVVWCGSQKVGCAASSDGVYVYCNYVPAGNYMGEYVANVPKVGGNCGSSNSAPARSARGAPASSSSSRAAAKKPVVSAAPASVAARAKALESSNQAAKKPASASRSIRTSSRTTRTSSPQRSAAKPAAAKPASTSGSTGGAGTVTGTKWDSKFANILKGCPKETEETGKIKEAMKKPGTTVTVTKGKAGGMTTLKVVIKTVSGSGSSSSTSSRSWR